MADLDVESALPDKVDVDIEEVTASEEEAGEYGFLEQEPEACQNFRLDTSRSFGTCKCGHPKKAHVEKATNKAAEMLSRLKQKNKDSVGSDSGVKEAGDKPCNKFRVDTTASAFGICKCGFKRMDHVEQQENKAKAALNKIKQSNLHKYDPNELTEGLPCENYRVDVSASEFGTCVCGYKKDDHAVKDENVAAKMLKNLMKKNEDKHKMEDMEAEGMMPEGGAHGAEVNQLTDMEKKADGNDGKEGKKGKKGKKKRRCAIQ